MIGPLQRRIRRVRYYSARRRETIWTRLAAIAMVVSGILAIPTVIAMELLVRQPHVASSYRGGVIRLDARGLAVVEMDKDGSVHWGDSDPYADFEVSAPEIHRGWPYATRVDSLPPRLDLNVFHESAPRNNASLAPDDPIRIALESTTPGAGGGTLRAWLHGDGPGPGRRVWSTTFGATVSWIMGALLVQLLLIGVARVVWRYATLHRRQRLTTRLSDGRCHRCGYDMRGLEFSDRCPECGTLVQ